MASFGYTCLLLAMIVGVYAAASSIVGHHTRSRRLKESSVYAVFGLFGLLTSASASLVYLFVTDDFSVKYVQHYGDRSMPLFYKATAFWGGQDGSLLFWVWVMSIWAAIAVYQNREKNKELMPYTIVAMMGVALYFLTLLLFVANPFETFLANAPTDGRGLNPLLQNPYMVTHPPSLYLGYIGWTIPFCFAIGALAHNKLDYGWIASMRRWCLVAWVFLSVGLTLGGLWAYEELGWGGYWAWDPVENAALMPWLTGTAFVHSIQVQERRQIFKLWNITLIIITFMLTLLGTMMTRSGVVQSVHAFAQSDIGGYFLVFITAAAAVSIGLLVYRQKELQPKTGLESILSREFAFLANNWVLLAAAFFVTFATLFPSLFKAVTGREVNVGPAFFNLWMIPIGLTLLFLTGVGPLLSWRKSTGDTIRRQFALPLCAGCAAAIILVFAFGITGWRPLICLTLCCFVTATTLQEYVRGTLARRANTGENILDALLTLVARGRRRYGGYVIHFGVAVMFLGFAGNAFKLESEQTVKKGEAAEIGRYKVRLDQMTYEDDGQKGMVTAHVSVLDKKSGEVLEKLAPAKWQYRKAEEQMTTEVDRRISLREDLYLVLGGYDAEAGVAALQLKVNPLVNFVWLGCSFLMIGFFIAVWPEPSRVKQPVRVRRFAAQLAGACLGALAILALVLAFV
jgi:cytochrome c-type biogenesis protein CcmF